ncbi:DNA repair protein Rad52/59/22 domain-containing protein [Desulfonema limicola]|uniref:DNA repair protein Rad52/59/22 domain-containing protein n=1 Tax=Desulfonema limicola TaxID=45656 RepID=A0A975BCA4_9BACT|nr:Rad52/Rad22 family DNA repair protein [Desulfonema limicola]QTA82727.1 DNA repair protein Rad52/59/22 domain-containing protein [Desulfonema limicola]
MTGNPLPYFNLEDLGKPFAEDDIEWRVQRAGVSGNRPWAMVLAYVTNRAIMERLDKIVGPENWQNDYKAGPEGGTLCGLSIKIGSEWITKWDGAEKTNIEAVKGALSGSMKRSAVHWGIGRYLYKLEATFAIITPNGKYYQKEKKNQYPSFKWNPPNLPAWAVATPEESQTAPKSYNSQKQSAQQDTPGKTMIDEVQHRILEDAITNLSILNKLDKAQFRTRVRAFCMKKWGINNWWRNNRPGIDVENYNILMNKLGEFAIKMKQEEQEDKATVSNAHMKGTKASYEMDNLASHPHHDRIGDA